MTAALTTVASRTPAFALRAERAADAPAREALLDICFGENRHARTCQRLRDGQTPAKGLAFSATRLGRLVGTLRLWRVDAGGRPALVLGPLAVDPACQSLGIGAALMRRAISEATRLGHPAIVLLGDAPYYARFGFAAEKAADLALPGPFERERLLGLDLRPGALDGARGVIAPAATAGQRARAILRAA
jgi:predicted N-acetyltransferase YhbS